MPRSLEIPPLQAIHWQDPFLWSVLVADLDHDLYWTRDWSPEFYAGQARAGFIAVAQRSGDDYLLPELQTAYAVLDWPDLHVSRSVARTLKRPGLRLAWNPDPAPVLDELAACRGERSWLIPPYRRTLLALAEHPPAGFRVWGIELSVDGDRVAGELGYTIGAVYTSLSGFRHEGPATSGLGTAQLVLLARDLEQRGFEFWNLGHPHMAYKLALGAKVLPRAEFLARWNVAVNRAPQSDSSEV